MIYTTQEAIPEASSMIETFRAIGYNVETAIADIIDNSISANAKNVWIDFEWKGEDTWISITDDGVGMNNQELIQAMRPGSKNPLEDRTNKDLGRFGLGLKTASFSQARTLTTISKKLDFHAVFWTWDLDYVNETGSWNMINMMPKNFSLESLNNLASGTIVIWNKIDRIVKNLHQSDKNALDKFLYIMDHTKNHLAMVFHRFIESKKLKLHFRGIQVKPWNPFLTDEQTTQAFEEEPLHNGRVTLKGYVLPHKSKISAEKYKDAEGMKGWNEHQGFYIYRNERLLLAGDWLGMFRKEEHYKLTRIQVDLPNSLDAEWQIDIKKSVARPPLLYRDTIKNYALKVRGRAVEVFRHRGKTIQRTAGQKFVPLWIDHKRAEKWHYKINREHPLIEKVKSEYISNPNKAIEMLIRFIEETIPTKSIYIKESEEPEAQGKPFEGKDQDIIRDTIKLMYNSLVSKGKTSEEAKSIIINIEPFNLFTHFFEFIN